jgi:hypothetical protein
MRKSEKLRWKLECKPDPESTCWLFQNSCEGQCYHKRNSGDAYTDIFSKHKTWHDISWDLRWWSVLRIWNILLNWAWYEDWDDIVIMLIFSFERHRRHTSDKGLKHETPIIVISYHVQKSSPGGSSTYHGGESTELVPRLFMPYI